MFIHTKFNENNSVTFISNRSLDSRGTKDITTWHVIYGCPLSRLDDTSRRPTWERIWVLSSFIIKSKWDDQFFCYWVELAKHLFPGSSPIKCKLNLKYTPRWSSNSFLVCLDRNPTQLLLVFLKNRFLNSFLGWF